MKVTKEHKTLLKSLGLKEADFKLFDGRIVRYEYDEKKGVRLYDPYYRTSYNEYVGIDGWSAWSEERNTFMSDILRGAKEEASRREAASTKPKQEELEETLRRKFGSTNEIDSQ